MHSGTWKRREREAAALFGALRNIGSGSLGRADRSCSDSTHPKLYLEVKTRPKHLVRDELDALRREIPAGSPQVPAAVHSPCLGIEPIVCFHSSDLARLMSDECPILRQDTIQVRDAVWTLMQSTAAVAGTEGKIPVLMLATSRKSGFVVCIRGKDADAFRDAYKESTDAPA
jgi:hypothetical protein